MQILIVEGVFPIAGHGIAVFGKISDPDKCTVQIRDEIEIRLLDGSTCDSKVIGIGIGDSGTDYLDLLLPLSVGEKIEVGAQLWQKVERGPSSI